MPKIYFIIHFFLGCYILRILSFDWPATFWPLTREPDFCQIWDWLCNINKNISFHFRLFQGKANDKIFQKIQSLFWGHFRPFFFPNLGKNEFSWKTGLCQFLNIPIICDCAKTQKKLMTHSWEKYRTDWRTDRQTVIFRNLRRMGAQKVI